MKKEMLNQAQASTQENCLKPTGLTKCIMMGSSKAHKLVAIVVFTITAVMWNIQPM